MQNRLYRKRWEQKMKYIKIFVSIFFSLYLTGCYTQLATREYEEPDYQDDYYFEDDYRAKRELENHIDLLIARHVKTEIADQIVLPPPPPVACQGDINVGIVEYMGKPLHDFNLNLKSLTRHAGIFGSTGSGKTSLALNLIRQLHAQLVSKPGPSVKNPVN